ncbi:MAG: cadmium-translocating P-type ATPase [Eubacterium sp.]|nr:cadmium-translocating P-type ATPase [Eubacterium sp.]
MEYKYILDGLDCANCAEKIRAAAEKSDRVTAAAMNFVRKELTVTADRIDEDELFERVEKIVKSLEPDVEVIRKKDYTEQKADYKGDIIKLSVSAVLFAAGFIIEHFVAQEGALYIAALVCYLISFVINGIEVAVTAFKAIIQRNFFNENTLMLVACIGAIILGEYEEAVAVMLFYSVGELFQSIAVNRSRRSINALIKTRPESAELLRDGEYVTVAPEEVPVGSIIRIKAGEKIPLDGVIVSGSTSVDTSALTGESMPRDVAEDDAVKAGTLNISGTVTVKTTAEFADTAVYKMLETVERAAEKKTKTENFITVFARYYTPAVVAMAVLLAVIPPLFTGFDFATWVQRGLIFLVISCPCALVISVPMGYFAGIGKASSRGVLVKGSNYLEAFAKAGAVLFDKTGTLTEGKFHVSKMYPHGVSEAELLETAAYAESSSNHPIAVSVQTEYSKAFDNTRLTSCEEIAGKGVRAVVDGEEVLCGNAKFLAENGIECEPQDGTVLYAARGGKYIGCIVIADTLKPAAVKTIAELKRRKIKTIMLTGDSEAAAKAAAEELGIDEYHSGLMPDDKRDITEQTKASLGKGKRAIFVGDGINDAPVIAQADVGIAMGAGADSAIETADAVLMNDSPEKLLDAINISRATNNIVLQNVIFALGVKLVIQVLGVLGIANMWAAVFADVGVTVIAVLNSLRLLKK